MSKQTQKQARNDGKPHAQKEPAPQLQPSDAPPPQQLEAEQERNMEYIRALLSGRAKGATRFETDLIEQLRRAEQEMALLGSRIEQLQTSLGQARTRRIALSGIAQQLTVNLIRWRDPKVVVPRASKPD